MTVLLAPDRTRRESVFGLARHGGRPAYLGPDGEVSYAELAERVDAFAHDVLGTTRRLVMVEGANHPDALVAYLAALQHGHVVLLVPDDAAHRSRSLMDTYDPDLLVRRTDDGWQSTPRREGSAHDLHPDLALLLSTSGSTGSPKLVRLSEDNITSNAASIAGYLGLTSHDRAATTLPLHYCYGLSVVHSHLSVGAGLLLTEQSVVDQCFWDRFDDARATSFAGVPYTFELLERSGFAERRHPSLRRVTQAGGRLAPDLVRRYASLGERDGWDLFVMYGQTEATARMAYLPPELAATRPEAIGVPIPGGSLRLDPVEGADPGVGELVYSGPNVMLGYADSAADLARGRTVSELRTGDLGRLRDGLFEVTGRTGRHAKLFGLRLDLDRVEEQASTPRTPVWCAAHGECLHAFTTRPRRADAVRARVAEAAGLPVGAVRVQHVAELPRTGSGKPDRAALTRMAELTTLAEAGRPGATAQSGPVTPEEVRDEIALVLGRPDATVDSTFVGLGGDSLSYVELATRLSRRLGDLPPDWPHRTATELASARRSGRGVLLDPTMLLRALAILAVVGSHADLFTVMGGAHVLLAVAGYNFARFHLTDAPRAARVRNALVATAQVVVPSTLFIAAVGLTTGAYDLRTAVYLNGLLGSDRWTDQWQFWFLEALVWTSVVLAALLSLRAFDRWERRSPFATAAALLAVALAVRFVWVGIEAGPTERYTVGVVAWCFAAGWLAQRARTTAHRGVVLLGTAAGVAGFFGDPQRELLVVVAVAALAWVPSVRVPARVASVVGVLAASSLFVYLTHWQVYPHLEDDYPLLATLASFAVGIAYWQLMRPLVRRLGAALR
ncbi:AMP-binding protein [Nocardioides sp.]|uniref:AMP-binding protein n=1 Tax=Nocardioides sp. TaxID=35761 RepID=UPI001A1D0DEA|nr:AMP-binding protein [Nocardioides sp.]MBJ7356783.1 AMP-binding protein [Nocardioides sp.]